MANKDPQKVLQQLKDEAAKGDKGLETNDALVEKLTRVVLKGLAKILDLNVKSNAVKPVFYEEVVLALNEEGLVSETLVESLSAPSQLGSMEKSFVAEAETVEVIQARAKAEKEKLALEREATESRLALEREATEARLLLEQQALALEREAEKERLALEREATEARLLLEQQDRRAEEVSRAEERRLTLVDHQKELELKRSTQAQA